MEQKSSQMFNEGPHSVPTIINTPTEEVQKCLEENKQLILFIMEKNRVGKQKECEMHVAKLQENLMFLTKLADALPRPVPELPPQIPASLPTVQQGHWLQHPEAAAMTQPQVASFARQPLMQLNDVRPQQPQQPSYLHQHYFTEAQMGFNLSINTDMQLAVQFGDGSRSVSSHNSMFDAMGNKQDGSLGSGPGDF